jgi:hypothetical protein
MGSLILSEELVLSGTTLKDILQSHTLDISSVSVLTNAKARRHCGSPLLPNFCLSRGEAASRQRTCSPLPQAFTSAASWKVSEYNTVVSLALTAQHHSEQFIRWLELLVRPGGKLILRQV